MSEDKIECICGEFGVNNDCPKCRPAVPKSRPLTPTWKQQYEAYRELSSALVEDLMQQRDRLTNELVALKASQKEAHKLLKYACDWLEYLGQPRVITRPNNKFTFQDIYLYFNSLPSPPETTEKGEG